MTSLSRPVIVNMGMGSLSPVMASLHGSRLRNGDRKDRHGHRQEDCNDGSRQTQDGNASNPRRVLCHAGMVAASPGTRSDLRGRDITSDYRAVPRPSDVRPDDWTGSSL